MANKIQKSIGAKVSQMFYGGDNPQIETLLNLYSLMGPEYINNKYFPIGKVNEFGNYGIVGALKSYKKRTGANIPMVQKINSRSGNDFKLVPVEGYKITEDDIKNIGQYGIDFKWYPNKYQEQYRNVINQLKPYVDYKSGHVGLKGTYNNTLPQWAQRFSHPLQVDIRY